MIPDCSERNSERWGKNTSETAERMKAIHAAKTVSSESKQVHLVLFFNILAFSITSFSQTFILCIILHFYVDLTSDVPETPQGWRKTLTSGDRSHHGGQWYQKWKMRAGGKGKMAKPVISSEKQKEFGACMTVWVHLKDNIFLSAIGFSCLSVLSYHQAFQNKSSQLPPLQVWY